MTKTSNGFALTILEIIPLKKTTRVKKVVTGTFDEVFGVACGELIDYKFFDDCQTGEETDLVIETLQLNFKDGHALVLLDEEDMATLGPVEYHFAISACWPASKPRTKKKSILKFLEPSSN